MRKRIADIVTTFRAEGLRQVREGLRQVRDDAKKTDRETNRVGSAAGQGFRKMAREGALALRGLRGAAAGAATGIVGAFTGAGKLIAKTVFSKAGIIGAAIAALGASAYSLLTPALGLGAVGSAALAGWFTLADLEAVRKGSKALGVPVDILQQWQYFGNTVGLTTDDVVGGMQAMQEAITESLDPDPNNDKAVELRALFSKIGLATRDAAGRVRPLSHVMLELAAATSTMNAEQKNFTLESILGDGLKYSELMDRIGDTGAQLSKEFAERKSRGLFASEEEINRIFEFRVGLQDLWITLKALARELFVTFIPVFEQWASAFEKIFSTKGDRASFIEKVFVRPFQRGLQWIRDFSIVFFGFDIDESLFGTRSAGVINTWMITLQRVLSDIWKVGTGLVFLFLGIGKAVLAAASAFDTFVQTQTGFSISGWMKDAGASDIEAFFRDLGTIIANAFSGAFDTSTLSTPFGRYLGDQLEVLKDKVEPIRAYLGTAMTEIWQAFQNGTGLDGVENGLARIIIAIATAIQSLTNLGVAAYDVFVGGETATGPFAWLNDLKANFETIRDLISEIAGIVGPMFAAFGEFTQDNLGISGGASLILGKVLVDALGKAPMLVVLAGITAGAFAALKALFFGPETYATDNTSPEANADRERMNALLDAAGGPKPGARENYSRTSALADERERYNTGSLIQQALADQTREMAEQAAQRRADSELLREALREPERRRAEQGLAPISDEELGANVRGKAEAALGPISLIANGPSFIFQLAGKAYQGIINPDQGDAFMRAVSVEMSRR